MLYLRKISFLFTLLAALSACAGTAGGIGLATQGNLSPEAIRLQSQTERLISLEQEQAAAKNRQASFIVQGAVLGGLGGALVGNISCRNCSEEERRRRTATGAVAGGVTGGVLGNAQANRQNQAASAENELRRRIQIAGTQLSTARTARSRAQAVLRANNQRLATVRRDLQAGRATQEQLELARSDAKADANQILAARRAMEKSARSMDQSGGEQSSRLASSRNSIVAEQNKTTESYNALLQSIANAAL